MVKIARILCPTNLSTESDEALRYAIALSRAYDATLLLLHCKDARQTAQSTQLNTDIVRSLEQAFLRHSSLSNAGSITWKPLVIEDVVDVGDTISEEARKHRADLIVMRSRRSPRAAVSLGSTAEIVSKIAPCPVLITHPNETEWVGLSGEIDLHRVLIAHEKIELICMGASGRSWSLDKLLGSNVDRVLRQAPCPVLVARPTKYNSSVKDVLIDVSVTS